MSLLYCTCGNVRAEGNGFVCEDDPDSAFEGWWVHNSCGKPTRLYLEAELVVMGISTDNLK